MNKHAIVIPARIASTRLPGKMLADLGGKPVVQHVIERVKQVKNCSNIYLVTDNEDIVALANNLDIKGLLTSPECRSGTERIASALDRIEGDWIFNVQGDEPFVDPNLISELIEQTDQITADMITPIFKIQTKEELTNPCVVKVVLDKNNQALYFSRSTIPFVRDFPIEDWLNKRTFWGHIGIYGYQRSLLEKYATMEPSDLEKSESLEQLRFLSNGYHIATHVTHYRPVAIDTQQDLDLARNILTNR